MRLSAPPLLGLLLLASACVEGPEGSSEPVTTTTHALLRVERSARVGAEDEATGVAFAGVVRVPELSDPEPLLRLFGKAVSLPAIGQCAPPGHERETPASDLSRAEFLKAGDVLLGANDVQTLLAPRAFRLEIPGFVYTSRDQASASLPSARGYLLKATGSEQLPPIELRVQAPEELMDVTIAGYPLGTLSSVDVQDGATVAWRPGDARDLVYVEVAGAPASGTLGICAFRDSDGIGALPRGLFGAAGPGSVTLHRLREVAADVPSLDSAEVRFDFALTGSVTFR